jgi:predicted RNA methylase
MGPFTQPEYVTCPTGLVLPKDIAEQRYFLRLPTAVDLFCGCGGFGLGFIAGGFEVVAASDWDVPAAVTYSDFRANVRHNRNDGTSCVHPMA